MAEVLRRHNVTVSGSGHKALVLGHGFGTDQRVWRRVRPWADRHFLTISFDAAGSGLDGSGYDGFRHGSLAGFAEDLLAILDAFEIGNCVYVGHETGAMAAVLASILAPDRFERMVLLAPCACGVDREHYRSGIDAVTMRRMIGCMTVNYTAWVREFASLAVDGPPNSASAEEVASCLAAIRPDVAFRLAMVAFQSDLRGWIDDFEVSAVLVHTGDDPLVPDAAVRYLYTLWPFVEREVLPVSGHLPHLTAPDLVVGVLARHLSDVARA
ncbi:MAG TPA: alpha/beta fold hydrolase [Azospirillum sp.]|nr:alpha/beta fold hydrolase [Azospirillum sp.]